MKLFGKLRLSVIASLAITLGMTAAGLHAACAQDATGPGGMQFFVTPYLWLAGINAAIKTPLPRAPGVNSSVGPFQLLGDLNGVPFMGAFEVRQGPLGFLGDVLHVPVGTNITTRNVFFQGSNAALKTNMGTALCSTACSISRRSSPISASAFALGASPPICLSTPASFLGRT